MEIHGTMPGVSPPTDDEPKFDGPSLDSAGNLDRRVQAVEPSAFQTPAAPPQPLELDRSERFVPQPEIEPEPPPPPPKRPSGLKPLLVVLLLAIAGLAAFFIFKPRIPLPEGVTPSTLGWTSAKGQLIIMSTPAGASITIGDLVVGTTPWAVDNRWDGDIKVRITARGYKTWEGTFTGGVDQTLNAELQPLKK